MSSMKDLTQTTYNSFNSSQNMILPSITEFLLTQTDLSILLKTTNHTFKSNNAKTAVKTLFVHLWELDTHLEQPILPGQMAL